MRGRGPMGAITSSPTMVGAVTTLIVIVAVFLAYNANNGLPFVPVYRVSVEVPDAARLGEQQRGPDRRQPGRRGGDDRGDPRQGRDRDRGRGRARHGARVERQGGRPARPEARQGRRAAAQGLDLPGPLPVLVRPQVPRDRPRHRRGRAGGLYVQRPRRRRDLRAAGRPRQLLAVDPRLGQERLLPAADRVRRRSRTRSTRRPGRTRAATWSDYGDAFAGRGTSLNEAISSLEPLFRGPEAR